MHYRLCFPYTLALLVAAQTSTVIAAEDPTPPPPHTWLTGVKSPQSPASWQSPLLNGRRDVSEKSPPAFHTPFSTPAKRDFVAGAQQSTGHCSSSYRAAACAAMIAFSAAVQRVKE